MIKTYTIPLKLLFIQLIFIFIFLVKLNFHTLHYVLLLKLNKLGQYEIT